MEPNLKNIRSSKCENCGSNIVYNPKERCLTCLHCDSNYFLPEQNSDAVLVRQYNSNFHPNQLNRNLLAYKCNNCSNITYMSSEEHSQKCLNCGGSSCTLVEDAGLCADGIIPFKISKQQASEYFAKYLKKKFGVPKELKNYAANQKLTGVYVPVWNFTLNVSAVYNASVQDLKKDERGSYYSVSKPVFGDRFKHIKSLDESATNAEFDVFLNLFDEDDYAEIIPYTPEYTYGFRVDTIDKDIHEFYHKITDKAENELEREIKSFLYDKYKDISDINVESRADDVFFNFTYVPVYVNTYKKKDKVYKTYISGTTGKVVGKSPTSIWKYLLRFFEFLLALGAVGAIIYFILNGMK